MTRESSSVIAIRVQPNAGRNKVLGMRQGVLRLSIAAPPVKGKANQELIRFLGELLRVPAIDISLARGFASRNKTVVITGLTPDQVKTRLEKASTS